MCTTGVGNAAYGSNVLDEGVSHWKMRDTGLRGRTLRPIETPITVLKETNART
jgi:hypothetical protein